MTPEMQNQDNPSEGKVNDDDIQTIERLIKEVSRLKSDVNLLYKKSRYEDLEHAELGLEIVGHALGEVAEHTGKGGIIRSISDPAALKTANELRDSVVELQKKATLLLTSHSENEDLQTGIKALEVSKGSFEEVVERYSG